MKTDTPRYVEIDIDTLKPYKNNARTHSPSQIEKICKSIEEFGFLNPVLIDGNNTIIAGHGRVMGAKKLGMQKVPCLYVEHLTDEQMRAYVIADNKLAEDAGWDMELLSIELSELEEIGFDISLTGFDFGADWFDREDRLTNTDGESEEYKQFLEKFEQEKTTDDCYTPDNIYNAVVEYVEKQYGLNRANFVRPFYPNGDYQKEVYKKNDVVVDNPPFSIFSEICKFYQENGIKCFLFGPSLSTFSAVVASGVTAITTGVGITYANGAVVSTSFVTNLENEYRARTDTELFKALEKIDKENKAAQTKEIPTYEYPDYIVTAAMMNKFSKYGVTYAVKKSNSEIIRQLESQKESGKAIFGAGFILSEKAAAEKAAAEKAAAEKAAAEKTAAIKWSLSDEEKATIKRLAQGDD